MLKFTPGQTGFAEGVVIPALGIPVQPIAGIKDTDPRNPRLFITPVKVPP